MSFPDNQDDMSKDEWVAKLEDGSHIQRVSMNNLIMNYLVTEGFKEAAEKFQQESGVGPTVELNSLDDRIRIRDAIQNGRIQEATDLVNQLHPELLDNDRYLYFHLQQLHLIELIRTGRIEEALQFAQEQLSEAGESDDNILSELERTLALLAFDEPHKSPFSDLLHPTHRQKYMLQIASELNAAILKMEHRETTSPRLNNLLKMILWAQDELDTKKVKYPKMTDLGSATIENPK
ncbi:glucose-induced degradation protein 8 homolog isoform X1 [Neodiprion virginianus]|uniref:Glucose-induced degradation protein 8 homolog isoform X1 n=1 Tax=Neodiprion lecontei TaxID=441921 RepID=A0ABM3FVL9_NEOLC|nr:glucose-induced degradation protein 8 homolog isoform X1 [Neodiprion fabricii]XP_046478328.1 glucose-induced degradation protein 8 homolog isoform X1 [Neodiprion pinetum]XP_046592068.1 glucose-induced degradation protein 8 homolog isoform X1 [Neodiprion lecontei]XP_046613280.1 glucose-induced degradation protein 8 homolog isoform X1 [Neodiprion virginianus]